MGWIRFNNLGTTDNQRFQKNAPIGSTTAHSALQ